MGKTVPRASGSTVLFGRYRLMEPAGSGGTAEVWRAVDERTGEEVALKRLHPIVFGTDSGRRRLAREFRALRSLRHPSIVRVRDLRIARDEGAIILDYVRGTSLAERLRSEPGLTPAEAVGIAQDVAAGLAAAHAEGIVHRDVTPGNILLDGAGRARLTDFGIARQDGDETVATGTGLLVGTLRYIAPEQLRGDPATPASDLFALAAVTYEMLAGRPAFAAATPVALVEAHVAPPPPLADVPSGVDQAVRAALSPNPADRQGSVAAFAEELRAAMDAAGRPDPDGSAATSAAGIAAVWAGANPAAPSSPVAPANPAAPAIPARPTDRRTASRRTTDGRRGRLAGAPLIALAGLLFGALVVAALTTRGPDAAGAAPSQEPSALVATPAPQGEGDDQGNGKGKGEKGNKGNKGGGKDD